MCLFRTRLGLGQWGGPQVPVEGSDVWSAGPTVCVFTLGHEHARQRQGCWLASVRRRFYPGQLLVPPPKTALMRESCRRAIRRQLSQFLWRTIAYSRSSVVVSVWALVHWCLCSGEPVTAHSHRNGQQALRPWTSAPLPPRSLRQRTYWALNPRRGRREVSSTNSCRRQRSGSRQALGPRASDCTASLFRLPGFGIPPRHAVRAASH